MSRNTGAKKRRQTIPVWTHAQALKAIPYLSSIMQTVRDYRIAAKHHHLQAWRLANEPGRLNRTALIAHQEETRDARSANDRFHDALRELHKLGVYCLDPVRGEALVPFAHDQQLAWFVYDMFDPEPLRFWRFHSDPLETRRPIAEIGEEPRNTAVA
jgi:hypothetical protein